jgi:myosin protein heavy chain
LERGAHALERQSEQARKQLEAESTKYKQLHQVATNQKRQLALDQDRLSKMDAALNKTLTELKNKEWEIKQLGSRQDKKIVEHVYVLEKAKKVTDQQLKDAQEELQKNAVYIRSLEKAKLALTREAEDFVRENKMEQVELRAIEKTARVNEERALKALAALESERKAREVAESGNRRLQGDLNAVKGELEVSRDRLSAVQRSKDALENELSKLAEEIDASPPNATLQREYSLKIAQLEEKLQDAETVQGMVSKIKAQVERQHKELLDLIMRDTPMDEAFRSRLVRELQIAEEELARQFCAVVRTPDSTRSPSALKDESTARLEESHIALVRLSEVWWNQHSRQDGLNSGLSNGTCSLNWKRSGDGLEKSWLVSTTSWTPRLLPRTTRIVRLSIFPKESILTSNRRASAASGPVPRAPDNIGRCDRNAIR